MHLAVTQSEKRSYKRPKCVLIAYRSRNISHGLTVIHPILKIVFQFDKYCARGLSEFNRSTDICLYNQYTSIVRVVHYHWHVYFVSFIHLKWKSWSSSLLCL